MGRRIGCPKASTRPSLKRLLKDLEDRIKDPYEGIMYAGRGNTALDGEWVIGIRKCDAQLALDLLRTLV